MDLKYLRLVKTIVEEGSISKSIDKLHLTQSALSHQLKEAETLAGVELFKRINKRLVLTSAGEIVLESANKILPNIEDLNDNLSKISNGKKGVVRISTECYTSYHWLPSVFKKFTKEYPEVEIKIVMEATHNTFENLNERKIDVAFTNDPMNNGHIEYKEMFRDEMLAIVSADHRLANKKYLKPEDFTDEIVFIHSLPLESVTLFNKLLIPNQVSVGKVMELPLTEATIEMIKANLGISVMAAWAVKPYLNNKQLTAVKVGTHGLYRNHYLAYFNGTDQPEYLKEFISFVLDSRS